MAKETFIFLAFSILAFGKKLTTVGIYDDTFAKI